MREDKRQSASIIRIRAQKYALAEEADKAVPEGARMLVNGIFGRDGWTDDTTKVITERLPQVVSVSTQVGGDLEACPPIQPFSEGGTRGTTNAVENWRLDTDDLGSEFNCPAGRLPTKC